MKYLGLILIIFVVLVGFLALLNSASAQTGQTPGARNTGQTPGGSVSFTNPLGNDTQTIPQLIDRIVKWLTFSIAPPIAALMILIGAFQMLFAAGNPEKFSTGKKTVLYTVIGYAIILVASGITSIIKEVLTVSGS